MKAFGLSAVVCKGFQLKCITSGGRDVFNSGGENYVRTIGFDCLPH